MFSFIADILTSITSILFPIFASYKALRTSDPAVLTPWLMYWTTLSLFLLAESQLYFIISWLPFYAWFRLGIHLYLVLPGQQGSVYIYKEYIHPFLEEHERQIDGLISDAHARAKEVGLDAVKRGVEYLRVQVLGMTPKTPSPQPSRNVSYSSYLMSRFDMPSARQGLAAAGTSEIFGVLGKALQQTTYPDSVSREAQVQDLTQSGTLIPASLEGEERTDFISTQRERLRTLLQAFDSEAYNSPPAYTDDAVGRGTGRSAVPRQPEGRRSYLATPSGETGMHQSRSESEFEDLAYEPMPDPEQFLPSREGGLPAKQRPAKQSGSGWSNWIWGNYGEENSVIDAKKVE